MTASLATISSDHYPISVDLRIAVAKRGFAPRERSTSPWSSADEVPHVFTRTIPAKSLPQPPSTHVRLLDPIDAYGRQLKTKIGNLPDTVSAYDDRISVLEEQACDEGYFLNSGSRETFQVFFRNNPLIRLGRLVLLENGNLRAVWKGGINSHIGLQFLDDGFIQYVLFKQRRADLPVSRAYGRDTPLGILQQISALRLDEILYP